RVCPVPVRPQEPNGKKPPSPSDPGTASDRANARATDVAPRRSLSRRNSSPPKEPRRPPPPLFRPHLPVRGPRPTSRRRLVHGNATLPLGRPPNRHGFVQPPLRPADASP